MRTLEVPTGTITRKSQKEDFFEVPLILIFVLTGLIIILKNKGQKKYDIESKISRYDLSDVKIEDQYMNYLKEYIYPVKLRKFINNNFVPTSLLSEEDTGQDMIDLMKEIGYEILFNNLFDKNRMEFDDCPVTDDFKKKFNKNLLDYYKIRYSDSCEIDCLIKTQENDLIVEQYDDFVNTEPTYWKTHHFHYILDSNGNVDDVTYDYTE